MDTFDAVQKAVGIELPQVGPLPPFLGTTVTLLRSVYLFQRTYKLGNSLKRAAADPTKGNPVVYGAALHLADHTPLTYALSAVLAAKCAADLLREYRHVSQSTQELLQTIKCQYPVYHPVAWQQQSTRTFFSPSLYLTMRMKLIHMITLLRKVSACVACILRDTFKLSMCTADAYLLLNGDQTARFMSFTELAADWESYAGELNKSKKRLLKALEKQGDLADRILTYVQAPESCRTLVAQLKKEFGTDASAEEGLLDDIQEVAQDALDPFYIPGKITAMHIDLSEGKDAPPELPKGRFPPWGGQKVTPVAAPKKAKSSDLVSDIGTFLFGSSSA